MSKIIVKRFNSPFGKEIRYIYKECYVQILIKSNQYYILSYLGDDKAKSMEQILNKSWFQCEQGDCFIDKPAIKTYNGFRYVIRKHLNGKKGYADIANTFYPLIRKLLAKEFGV